MGGFVEILGFGPMEQKTLAATFALSLRRERVYSKWRAGSPQSPNIVLFDGDDPDVLLEVMARKPNPEIPLVAVALQAPHQVACFHVERPIRFVGLLDALDQASIARRQARHAATLPLPVQALPRPSFEKFAATTGKIVSLVSSAERPALARVSDQTLSTNNSTLWALVVDDDLAVRRFMSSLLAPFNINVDYAGSGEQAIGLTGSKHYACVFLDVVMPGMDGYQVCKLIKSKRSGGDIRVVMLTSRGGTFDKIRGKMAGCDAYLTKPIDQEKLMTLLVRFLGVKATAPVPSARSETHTQMATEIPKQTQTPRSPDIMIMTSTQG